MDHNTIKISYVVVVVVAAAACFTLTIKQMAY